MFQELKKKLLAGETTFTIALPQALPALRGKITDDKLVWLASELQGYSNAMDYYNDPKNDLPKYRIVRGSICMMKPDGSMHPVQHPMANREEFFLGAPISWIEEFATFPGDTSLVELPELSAFTAKQGGGVVCQCQKAELRRIIAQFRNDFIKLLDQVVASSPSSQ